MPLRSNSQLVLSKEGTEGVLLGPGVTPGHMGGQGGQISSTMVLRNL